jgi:glycine oxidase
VLTGLRGRLEAADRRNLIRVMPAKGAGMSTSATADVLVIGGGVIGLSIAWRAAQRGLRVAVADPEPGGGASHAAAGMITPISEAAYAEKELFRLGRESQRRYPAFAAELTGLTGEPTGYRQAGTLQVAYDADDLAILGEYQALQESFGVTVRRLTARECRQAEPMLSPAVRGGLLAADDASVDPRLLTRALVAAAVLAGVDIVRQPAAEILTAGGGHGTAHDGTARDGTARDGTARDGPASHGTTHDGTARDGPARDGPASHGTARDRAVSDSRVAGALLGDGTRILAPWVVLAAGWNSATIAGLPPGIAPPVRPVKGQILRLRSGTGGPGTSGPDGMPGLLARSVRGIVHGSAVYLVPRDSGELVIGATQEELGTDIRVTAGGVWELLRDARTIVPGITELELAEAVAGLRPGTPDNAPVLGPSPLPGLVLATGHFRAGVLLAPVTADVIAEYLATRRLPDLAAAFTPRRFAQPAGAAAAPGRNGRSRPRAAGRNPASEGAPR